MTAPHGEWPADTRTLPPAPPPAAPPGAEPGNRIGMGMLLAIVLLAGFAVALAAILISRHHHKSAAATTVIVTTTAVSTPTTTTTKPKVKLLLPVPSTIGMSIPQAVSAVQHSGLHLVLLRRSITDQTQAGKVVGQTPPPGQQAPKNSRVVVYMGAVTG